MTAQSMDTLYVTLVVAVYTGRTCNDDWSYAWSPGGAYPTLAYADIIS